MILEHVFIGKDAEIGHRCKIQFGAYIPDHVVIHDDVFIGPHVVFTNDKYPPSDGEWKKSQKTHVLNGASIGANSTILPGVTIGFGAVIGAGSVVTHNIMDYATAYGNPARIVKVKG